MNAKSSISRAPVSHHASRHISRLAVLTSLLAALLLIVGIISFANASRLMRQPSKPLGTFTSNVLPSFNLASFPSLDEQTMLSGWFFPAKNPISTIILVHDQGLNRLQFGLDSASFYQFLIEQHFNVLAFDLRNSGQSEGEMSAFGYAEWADVLAAIRYVRKNAATRDVLLYGFGSGASASLIALDQLPPANMADAATRKDANAVAGLAKYPKAIRNLGFDQAYVRGLMLDTPCESPDAFIRAICRQESTIGRLLLQYTVPYAIRLSAGNMPRTNLITILTRSQLPVFISYSNEDTQVGVANIIPLIEERSRLHPDTTIIHTGTQPSYTSGFLLDQSAYKAAIMDYFKRFFN